MKRSLIYPTIDLYLYDLRHGLGQDAATLKQNDWDFLAKLPPYLRNDINSPEISQQTKWKQEVLAVLRGRNGLPPPTSENPSSVTTEMMEWDTEFLELLTGQIEPLQLPAAEDPKYEGYYYPVQLGDTYALLVDASVRDRTSPTSLENIASLTELIATKIIENRGGSLGQTWFVSAQLPWEVNTELDIEAIALECYRLLLEKLEKQPEWKEKPQGRGEFLGGKLFEWNQPNLKDIPSAKPFKLDEQANPHVLIALYRSSAAAERAGNFIEDWMRLFCYRHKILWAYAQSRRVKGELQNGFAQIQDYIGNFKTEKYKGFSFAQLAQKLGEAENLFSDYAINLSYLEFQMRTIEVNLHNYRQRRKELEQKASGEGLPFDLKWLEDFPRYASEQYLRQIRKDCENLSGGLKLLGIAVDLIRTDVQVKEARRDRAFQNTLGIVGAGLAAASVTASISGQFPNVVAPVTLVKSEEAKATVEQNLWQVLRSLTISEPWLMPSVSLVLSLGVGVVAAGLTGLAVWLRGLGSHGNKK